MSAIGREQPDRYRGGVINVKAAETGWLVAATPWRPTASSDAVTCSELARKSGKSHRSLRVVGITVAECFRLCRLCGRAKLTFFNWG
jgi:hypothetical protein